MLEIPHLYALIRIARNSRQESAGTTVQNHWNRQAGFPLELKTIPPLHKAISGVDNLIGMRFMGYGRHHLKRKDVPPGPFSLVDLALGMEGKDLRIEI